MKNADMKKPCSEEKTGLKKGLSGKYLIKSFFIFFIFSQNTISQIPVKGFCKYNFFDTNSGFTNLVTMNFNGDFYADLVLFNPGLKQIISMEGGEGGQFGNKKVSPVPYEINNLMLLDHSVFPYMFAFTSRANMRAGIYEFRSNGAAILMNSIKFDSYPENISVADVNNSGRKEMLISGGAFDGLSIIFSEDNRLREKKIIQSTAFSQSSFIDLNNDGYPDIAAFDVLSGSFTFFYNNSLGEFRKVRSIPVAARVTYLKTFDLDLDSYPDLIFTAGKSINIWYGDFRSSYENRNRIDTRYIPDKFIVGDFNKDGLMDIAYLNYGNSVVSVIYAKDETTFYPEIIYLQKNSLRDIVPYYSRFINGIAALSSEGNVYTITNLSSLTDTVDITIAAKPNAITFFDNEKNGINNICFVDEYDSRVKFIIRNKSGIPEWFYSYPLYENHSAVIAESINDRLTNFVCYSTGKKLIEIIKADFKNNVLERTALYTSGDIIDLKLKRKSESDYNIHVLYTEDDKLLHGVFYAGQSDFTFSEQQIASGKILNASVSVNEDISVFYWQQNDISKKDEEIPSVQNELLLMFINSSVDSPRKVLSLPVIDNALLISYTGDLLNTGEDILISFLEDSLVNYTIVASGNFYSIIRGADDGLRITSKNQLFFGETRFKGLKRLCVYVKEQNTVNRLEISNKGRNIIQTKLADVSHPGSYFIKNMTWGNYHIVYTDLYKNCITIRRLI
jgi:hypothetical protein